MTSRIIRTDRGVPDDPLGDAIEFAQMVHPMRSYPGTGAIWIGSNEGLSDGSFTDWGVARAVAIIMNAVVEGKLVRADSK
jgi:hypothetical protein